MPDATHNLLVEPLLHVRHPAGHSEALSLPEVFAALVRSEVAAFDHLRPHQSHAWHAFLVQLAAIALHRAGETAPAPEADTWRAWLRAITRGQDEPWCLQVPDLSRPAFMQPPVPEGTLAGFQTRKDFPDGLDILNTAKNHDVKARQIVHPATDHWVFALVTLQTMQGYFGSTNYGICRMNAGNSNRPSVSYVPGWDVGRRFLRDVNVLGKAREGVAASHGLARDGGIDLLWLEPWDGKSAITWERCDPWFVEICRRVRLIAKPGGLAAVGSGTACQRVNAKDRKGDTGDPWTPVHRKEGKSLTVSATGFPYRRVKELLLDNEYMPGAAFILGDSEHPDTMFHGWALARGDGKTEGLHERLIPVPGKIRARLRAPDSRASLGNMARQRIERVATVQRSLLHPSLCVLLQGAPTKLELRESRSQRWLNRFDAEVDRIFFERLWQDADLDPLAADLSWQELVCDQAWRVLQRAIEEVPMPSVSRYRAIAAAERLFSGSRRKHFPDLSSTHAKGARP